MTEKEQKAIEKLEIEGTENNYLEVKIVLDLVDKQQETLRKQSYTNKKLRNKIKTVRKERNKLKADIEIKDKVIEKIKSKLQKHINFCEQESRGHLENKVCHISLKFEKNLLEEVEKVGKENVKD